MNYDRLNRLTDEVLREVPTTPVPTDAVPDARLLANLWSGLLVVRHSAALALFEDPITRMSVIRHRRVVVTINDEVDAAGAAGRQDLRMGRNTWEAVLQAVISRRDDHRRLAELALMQFMRSPSHLVVDLTVDQQEYVVAMMKMPCPESVPVAALQALRVFGGRMERPLPWVHASLPDMRDSFPVTAVEEHQEYNVDEEEALDEAMAAPVPHGLSFSDILSGLRKAVIGQDESVREFSACAYRHLREIRQGAVLVSGPTGVGKTSLASAWGALSDRPVISVDCAALVPEGVRGATMGDALIALWSAAGKDLGRACSGVLILDEFDKIPQSQFALQLRNALLRLIDGCEWRSFDTEKIGRNDRLDSFPTHDLLIVLCGSFSDMRHDQGRTVGFETTGGTSAAGTRLDVEDLVPLADLRGRIGCHVELRPLDRAALTEILLSDNGPLRSMRCLFSGFLVELPEPLVDRIVTSALKANLGARGLWPLLRELETRLLLDPPSGPGEHHGVQFSWRLRMLAGQQSHCVPEEVVDAPREVSKVKMRTIA